ncbi:MAG: hypothetical protein LBI09_00310 [Nitrososphaerota archaeon]|jgi:hypothetical protein|nr:hypothetical protein [Nitrososphaerota archaeon]
MSTWLPSMLMIMVLGYVILAILLVYLLKRTKIKRRYIGAVFCFFLFSTVITIFLDPMCLFAILILLIIVIGGIIVDWFEKFMQRRNGAVEVLKCSEFLEVLRFLDCFFEFVSEI